VQIKNRLACGPRIQDPFKISRFQKLKSSRFTFIGDDFEDEFLVDRHWLPVAHEEGVEEADPSRSVPSLDYHLAETRYQASRGFDHQFVIVLGSRIEVYTSIYGNNHYSASPACLPLISHMSIYGNNHYSASPACLPLIAHMSIYGNNHYSASPACLPLIAHMSTYGNNHYSASPACLPRLRRPHLGVGYPCG